MKSSWLGATLIFVVVAFLATVYAQPTFEPVRGRIGASDKWQSGWLDLNTPTDFKQGDMLRIRVGGNARKIVIRLLPEGEKPDDPVGFEACDVPVPESRVVERTLGQDHPRIKQISVHGGPNPWGLCPLGGGNGPATLFSVHSGRP